MRFSIRSILALVALSAWIVSVFMPGGLYVTLPVGLGVLLLLSCINAVCFLSRSRHNYTWRTLQLVFSLLLLISLLAVYPPFWSYAANRADHERDVAAKRTYIIDAMSAESVRDDGRKLLHRMKTDSIQTVFPSATVVPETLRELDPLYIEARDEYLLVVLGNQPDSFDLLIYADGADGRGTKRLSKGIWFFQPGTARWITDEEWDDGVYK